MFSIYYLEIISSTKLIAGKKKSDAKLGMLVNYVISGFYFVLFCLILILQIKMTGQSGVLTDKQTSLSVYFIKNWYTI